MKTMTLGDVVIEYNVDTLENVSAEVSAEFLKMTHRDSVVYVESVKAGGVSESDRMEALQNFCANLDDAAVIYEESVAEDADRDCTGAIKLAAASIKLKAAGFTDISFVFGEKYSKQFLYYKNREGISAYGELKTFELGVYMYEILGDEKCTEIFRYCMSKEPNTRKKLIALLESVQDSGGVGEIHSF